MRRVIILIEAIVAILSLFKTASGTIWYVHPDSTLNSIQTGLNYCSANDTVLVASGTYFEHIQWPLVESIKLLSESGYDSTIIDGNSGGRIITMPGSFIIDSTTVIKGFTLQNGYSGSGGAIYCFHASPKITGNKLINNYASGGGGAIHSHNANPIIIGNIISKNHAGGGGGIYRTTEDKSIMLLTKGNRILSKINNNIIANNEANWGGGIFWYNEWGIEVKGNAITDNHASCGGGIFCFYAEGCIMSDNAITANSADSVGGGIYLLEYTGYVTYNTIANNNAGIQGDGIYCDGYGGPYPMTFNYNNIYDNGCGLYNALISQTQIDAEYNWWGDLTGPYHPILNPYGQGDTVSDSVDFTPWLTEPTGLEEVITLNRPIALSFIHNYPNPFSSKTTIFYQLLSDCCVSLKVYNIAGERVRTLVSKNQEPGHYAVNWDGRDSSDKQVTSGVYFIKIQVGSYTITKKIIFLK